MGAKAAGPGKTGPVAVHETVVVAPRDDVTDQREQWMAAYATEPD
jgi:hypothetical protein